MASIASALQVTEERADPRLSTQTAAAGKNDHRRSARISERSARRGGLPGSYDILIRNDAIKLWLGYMTQRSGEDPSICGRT